jgi:hypothetical protein
MRSGIGETSGISMKQSGSHISSIYRKSSLFFLPALFWLFEGSGFLFVCQTAEGKLIASVG